MKRSISIVIGLILLAGLVWGVMAGRETAVVAASGEKIVTTSSRDWECWDDGTVDPYHTYFHATGFFSANDGWAVGGNTLLHWDGTDWIRFPFPDFNSSINDWFKTPYSIDMVTSDDVWVVGGLTILHWDGSEWTAVSSPITYPLFYDVSMLSATDGWIVGDQGTILRWNGSNWNIIYSNARNKNLYGISLFSADNGWAVGEDEQKLHWNGSQWTAPFGWSLSDIDDLFAVDMASPDSYWAVGLGGQYEYFDGVSHTFGDAATHDLLSIDMVSDTEGWAVGEFGSFAYWDGVSWEQQDVPAASFFFDIDMVSPDEGWVTSFSPFLHLQPPTVTLNYNSGAPGSIFTATGENFPENSVVMVCINGHDIGTTMTDEYGTFWSVVQSWRLNHVC